MQIIFQPDAEKTTSGKACSMLQATIMQEHCAGLWQDPMLLARYRGNICVATMAFPLSHGCESQDTIQCMNIENNISADQMFGLIPVVFCQIQESPGIRPKNLGRNGP